MLLDFEADESDAEELACSFAGVLDEPGWYADFNSPAESFVVFPGCIFRYRRGEQARRRLAEAPARAIGAPEQ